MIYPKVEVVVETLVEVVVVLDELGAEVLVEVEVVVDGKPVPWLQPQAAAISNNTRNAKYLTFIDLPYFSKASIWEVPDHVKERSTLDYS